MKKTIRTVIHTAEIISAVKLSDSQKAKIIEMFPNIKNKMIVERTDRSLIGGFIVRQESEIFDASINGKINYLLNKIYENYR